MLKASVPRNTTASSRPAVPPAIRSAHASRNCGRGAARSSRLMGVSFSCFHSAIRLRMIPTEAAPCTTRTSVKRREIAQQPADHDGRNRHAQKEHHVEQRHDARAGLLGGAVGGQRQPGGLGHVQPEPSHQEGHRGEHLAGPLGTGGLLPGQHQKREGHHREAPHLPQRAEPEIGDALPAQRRAMGVGAKAEHGAERRDEHGQGDHGGHHDRGHRKLHDHHAVERAQQHHGGHADRDLKQRQPQELRQRQALARRVGEGQPAGRVAHQLRVDAFPGRRDHPCTSIAWLM